MITAFITELNDENHDNFINTSDLSLVDVKAEWCNPCKQLSPIIDKLSVDYQGQVAVGKLDADKNPQTIEKLSIRSIPTIFIYKNGKVVEKLTGLQSYQALSSLIQKHSS